MDSELTKEEQQYLLWFFKNADFGPADCDVRYHMNNRYEKNTGNSVPDAFKDDDE